MSSPQQLSNILFHRDLTTTECGPVYDLSPEEKALAEIVFWARNKKKGLEMCRKQHFYPGPQGHKNKVGSQWLPSPHEGCDCQEVYKETQSVNASESAKWAARTYLWRNHCKSIRHIEYLIKHRFKWVFDKFIQWESLEVLKTMINMTIEKDYPLYISRPEWLIKEYISDRFTGAYQDPYLVSSTSLDIKPSEQAPQDDPHSPHNQPSSQKLPW